MVDADGLPGSYTVRPPVADDIETVFQLFAARNTAVLGFADLTLDDIVEEFADPAFDPTTDGWLVHGPDGRAVGYGCVYRSTSVAEHHIEVTSADPEVSRWLLDQVLTRSVAAARDDGHPSIALDIGVYRADDAQRELIESAGFARETIYQRLRIDHHGEVSPPELPAGIVQRSGADGPEVRRAAHAVLEEAFAGQYGISPQPYDEWHGLREARTTFDWSQLVLLELDGQPVATREDNDGFVEDLDCGYIQRLGVLEGARGRGLAKVLLRDAFATHAAAGRTGTVLHVDTNNPTPALDLYTSVGMELVLVIDAWRLTLPT